MAEMNSTTKGRQGRLEFIGDDLVHGEEEARDFSFNELYHAILDPLDRIEEIGQKLRKAAEDLQAGKQRSYKQIRKLAVNLSHWKSTAFLGAIIPVLFPMKVFSARCEEIRKKAPPKPSEPKPEISPEEKANLEKFSQAFMGLHRIFYRVKTGEISRDVLSPFIEKAAELAPPEAPAQGGEA